MKEVLTASTTQMQAYEWEAFKLARGFSREAILDKFAAAALAIPHVATSHVLTTAASPTGTMSSEECKAKLEPPPPTKPGCYLRLSSGCPKAGGAPRYWHPDGAEHTHF